MYDKSAQVYDLIYRARMDYEGHVQALHRIVQERNPAATSWLDVACGTGIHLELLSGLYQVEGVDIERAMLDIARERLPETPLHLCDMLDLSLEKRFDVVSCLFSSIGYMGTTQNLERAISAMARHLSPGGLLFVEPWLSPDSWTDGHLASDFVDRPDVKLARMSHNRREGRATFLQMHHLVLTSEGAEYFIEEHELFMFHDGEYRRAFEKAGLQVELMEGGLAGRGLYVGVA